MAIVRPPRCWHGAYASYKVRADVGRGALATRHRLACIFFSVTLIVVCDGPTINALPTLLLNKPSNKRTVHAGPSPSRRTHGALKTKRAAHTTHEQLLLAHHTRPVWPRATPPPPSARSRLALP